MLTDLVLRQFALLPVAWGSKPNLKEFHVSQVDKDSPADTVRYVLQGLKKSYEIAGHKLELMDAI
jgi:hypothetical protein